MAYASHIEIPIEPPAKVVLDPAHPEPIEDVTRKYSLAVLEANAYDFQLSAIQLGICEKTLYRWARKYRGMKP